MSHMISHSYRDRKYASAVAGIFLSSSIVLAGQSVPLPVGSVATKDPYFDRLEHYPTVAELKGLSAPVASRIQMVPNRALNHLSYEARSLAEDSLQQMEANGYIMAVDDSEQDIIELALGNLDRFISIEKATEKLTFQLENVTGTWLDSAELIGVHLEGTVLDGKHTAATRLFRLDSDRYVLVSEVHYVHQGARSRFPEVSNNFEIAGLPGSYINVLGVGGHEQATVNWFGGSKGFELIANFLIEPDSRSFKDLRTMAEIFARVKAIP